MRTITHQKILDYFESISNQHISIEGFYRYHWGELQSALRNRTDGYVLLMESHAGDLSKEGTRTFNRRTVSLLVLKAVINSDDYSGINEVLDGSEQICLDIVSRLIHDSKEAASDRNSEYRWLRGFDPGAVNYDVDPASPLFIDMYGYNMILELPNPEELCYEPEKWVGV
jgi:hypothetical protein